VLTCCNLGRCCWTSAPIIANLSASMVSCCTRPWYFTKCLTTLSKFDVSEVRIQGQSDSKWVPSAFSPVLIANIWPPLTPPYQRQTKVHHRNGSLLRSLTPHQPVRVCSKNANNCSTKVCATSDHHPGKAGEAAVV